jgi:hypothetical protein
MLFTTNPFCVSQAIFSVMAGCKFYVVNLSILGNLQTLHRLQVHLNRNAVSSRTFRDFEATKTVMDYEQGYLKRGKDEQTDNETNL